MSGHSKWAQIKRQKGASDVKRGLIFTKISNLITIAVKEGGGVIDPKQNFKLRLAVEKAMSVNMPKGNILRAIERASGKNGDSSRLQGAAYEGFGPGGVSIMVDAATDNKLRTTSEIKNVFEKNGGTLASPGAVSYQFQQKGLITIKKSGKTIDDIFLIAADFGAEDIEDAGDKVLIYTPSDKLAYIRDKFISEKFVVSDSELIRKPIVVTTINNQQIAEKILLLIQKLEDLDDVQKTYANFDIPDNLLLK